MKRSKLALYTIITCVLFSLIIVGPLYYKYSKWLETTKEKYQYHTHKWPSYFIPEKLLRRLGYFFPRNLDNLKEIKAKPKGVVRIALLGDSFTWGDELEKGYNFADYLKSLFLEKKIKNVEIYNFSTSGWGFTQPFIMWRYYRKQLDFDLVILGPHGFHRDRDTSFTIGLENDPRTLASMFINQNGKLKELKFEADNYQDAFDKYHSFLPTLRRIKHERFAPTLLLALKDDNHLMNPFYSEKEQYRRADKIYRMMIAEILQHSKVLLLRQNPMKYLTDIKHDNFFHYTLPNLNNLFDLRILHFSKNGNLKIAKIIFNLLTQKNAYKVKDIIGKYDLKELKTSNKTLNNFKFNIGNNFDFYFQGLNSFTQSMTDHIEGDILLLTQQKKLDDAYYISIEDIQKYNGSVKPQQISRNLWHIDLDKNTNTFTYLRDSGLIKIKHFRIRPKTYGLVDYDKLPKKGDFFIKINNQENTKVGTYTIKENQLKYNLKICSIKKNKLNC